MAESPLEGALAAAIFTGMRNLFLDATLLVDAPTSTSPDIDASFDPPDPVTTSYACKAIKDNYTTRETDGDIVQRGDAKILILANSVSVTPVRGNRVTIQGTTFRLENVERDPATALYTCQGRQ